MNRLLTAQAYHGEYLGRRQIELTAVAKAQSVLEKKAAERDARRQRALAQVHSHTVDDDDDDDAAPAEFNGALDSDDLGVDDVDMVDVEEEMELSPMPGRATTGSHTDTMLVMAAPAPSPPSQCLGTALGNPGFALAGSL